jgi:hypothetical protein
MRARSPTASYWTTRNQANNADIKITTAPVASTNRSASRRRIDPSYTKL